MKIQDTYNKFKKAEAEFQKLEAALDADWENEELEAKLDNYYENTYYPIYMELVDDVQKLTRCDVRTARAMIGSNKFAALMGMKIM